VTGSYFFNNTSNTNNQVLNRQYFLGGDSTQYYKENSFSTSQNYNNRVNLRVEYKIDSFNSLILTPVLNFQNNKSFSSVDGTNSYSPTDSISRSISNYTANTSGYNLSNTLTFRHAFAKRGRTFSVGITTGYNDKKGETYLQALSRYYSDTTTTNDSLQQYINQVSNGYQLSTNLAYTEPVGKKGQLQFNYNPSYSKSNSDQETYQYDYSGGKYSLFDTSLSSKFNSNYTTQNGGISYRYGDRNAYSDTLFHACGSEGTRGNQCDCQQLYRQLEQRKRCDRLSVGRMRQAFYQLRLSGFGRRKHDQLQRDRVKCGDDLLLPITSLQWELYKPQFQRHQGKDEKVTRLTAEGKSKR